MPVDGYDHKRVWQYNFLPQPVTLLDRGWDHHDHEWERSVVEKLRRGQAAPRSIALNDLITDSVGVHNANGQGWEATEEHCKNANRTNSAFLTDEMIASRAATRKLIKDAWLEKIKDNKEYYDKMRPVWEEERKAKAEIDREYWAERERTNKEFLEKRAKAEEEQRRREAEWIAAAQAAPHVQKPVSGWNAKVARQMPEWHTAPPVHIKVQVPDQRSPSKKMWDNYVEELEDKDGKTK